MFSRPELAAPDVEFHCIFHGMTPPKPASDTVNGFMPTRAKAYCPPVTVASGYGFWLYPPVSFALRWDGMHSEWAYIDDRGEPTTEFKSLAGGVDVVPDRHVDWSATITRHRGEAAAQQVHPDGLALINADPRSENLVELELGVVARTSPGWALAIRNVPNWPSRGVQVMDGIIETDWYRASLGTVLRIVEPGTHKFFQHIPVVCAQPVPLVAFAPTTMSAVEVHEDPDAFVQSDLFDEFVGTRAGRYAVPPPTGNYRTMARHAAANRCPYMGHPDTLSDAALAETHAGTGDE